VKIAMLFWFTFYCDLFELRFQSFKDKTIVKEVIHFCFTIILFWLQNKRNFDLKPFIEFWHRDFPQTVTNNNCVTVERFYFIRWIRTSFSPPFRWAMVTIATLGKAFVTFSFAAIYLYTAELYPTVLRTTGMGISSFAAR